MLLLTVASLSVTIVAAERYQPAMKRAGKLMEARDPDDIELLALAIHSGLPLWSNDNDFEQCGVPWFTTAEVLRKLGISGK
jgi:predicted nucleic acid-binding protein